MVHTRAHIQLNNQSDAMNLVQILCRYEDSFSIENFDGSRRVNAKSILGVMYAAIDFNNAMYLVNDVGGVIPGAIDDFRVLSA